MFAEAYDYLKDPHLVARIQKFFGVRIHRDKESPPEAEKIVGDAKSIKKNGFVGCVGESNGPSDRDEAVRLRETQCSNECDKSDKADSSSSSFTIHNYFWYYLFLFGTELGDETFYSVFIPFWFWNVDGSVGRRVVLVWAIVMTVGQVLKDILCWPRPACPPAVRLQSKWSQEYGMPSTHAMIGIAIPFSVVLFTMNRYIYPLSVGFTIATLWSILVFTSRLYLGMHTVLDIVAGVGLAIFLMLPLVPLVDYTDHYILTTSWALPILIVISLATVIYYPSGDRWTPTRGDTAMVVSVTTGVHAGAWVNYKIGALSTTYLPPPYIIVWPSYLMLGSAFLRTIIGLCCIIGTKAVCKTISYATMCAIMRIDYKELMNSENSLDNKKKIIVDLVYKCAAPFMIGFNALYLMPNVFATLGLGRPTFYTEM